MPGTRPMMSVGDVYDNAPPASFRTTSTGELLDREQDRSLAEARQALFGDLEGGFTPPEPAMGNRAPAPSVVVEHGATVLTHPGYTSAVHRPNGTVRGSCRNIPTDRTESGGIMQPDTPSKSRGLPPGQVSKGGDLVNYQDDAIVSREIVKKSTGNVTVFAFDEGQGLSEHTTQFDALVQVLEGEAEITISGQPHHLHGGELILMPAGHPHALKALTRFKMILVMIRS